MVSKNKEKMLKPGNPSTEEFYIKIFSNLHAQFGRIISVNV